MRTDEILKLSRPAIVELLRARMSRAGVEPYDGPERRKSPRWPFPGQVELRPLDDDHAPSVFCDCRDLSETGLGMRGEQAFEIGTVVELSMHLPEATFYGQAIVRYCMRMHHGHMIGVEFIFEE